MAGEEVNFELSGNAHVAGDAMLIAAGRSPSIDGIDLDRAGHRAGIAFDEHGVVNDVHLRTTNAPPVQSEVASRCALPGEPAGLRLAIKVGNGE